MLVLLVLGAMLDDWRHSWRLKLGWTGLWRLRHVRRHLKSNFIAIQIGLVLLFVGDHHMEVVGNPVAASCDAAALMEELHSD